MADLNGHEAGNGGHSQGKPTAYRDSSTRRDGDFSTVIKTEDAKSLRCAECKERGSCMAVDCNEFPSTPLNPLDIKVHGKHGIYRTDFLP